MMRSSARPRTYPRLPSLTVVFPRLVVPNFSRGLDLGRAGFRENDYRPTVHHNPLAGDVVRHRVMIARTWPQTPPAPFQPVLPVPFPPVAVSGFRIVTDAAIQDKSASLQIVDGGGQTAAARRRRIDYRQSAA